MPKRHCKFNSDLQEEFPFIKKRKTDSDVLCETCGAEFTVSHGGKSDITKHIKSDRHKLAVAASASSTVMTTYFRKASGFGSKEMELAAAEGVLAYHTVCHNQSFRSMDCTSKLIQKLFKPKFACARTKTEAIVVNVFSPWAESILKSELEQVNFVSIYTDASNHKHIKIFPILIRYFNPNSGIHVKVLEMQSLPGETSDIVVNYLRDVLKQHNVWEKLVAFCADNTNSNFGGAARRGQNNVFYKMKESIGHDIVGIGCAAHIVHNAVQTASDCLPIDVEAVIVKIYSHFYIYTVRVEAFKDFCEFASVEYQHLLGYSKTRWLALMPAVERVLQLFEALKSYFLSIEKCPVTIKCFFENPCSEIWLYFIHSQAAIFHATVLQIESQNTTAMEVAMALSDLRTKYQERLENGFLSISVRSRLTVLEENGEIERGVFMTSVSTFYSTCISYLEQWSGHFQEIQTFMWVILKEVPTWNNVEKNLDYFHTKFSQIKKFKIDENLLFDEVIYLKKYVTEEKIQDWQKNKTAVGERWVEIFRHFERNHVPFSNIGQIVQFLLSLPGTNAAVERVFSLMNNLWTEEKTQLKVETLKAMMIVKCNIGSSCQDFFEQLRKTPSLLKKIHGSEKY